ncbi:RidA family protein [Rhizobium leguminosarum]|uniref:RidA family protein n=1 Tax=Rhizobium leguminosarum TaxID=384 RepID=UPI0021BBEBED|nr:RidA family protein [Rhizobium leguminosarum]MBY5406432.1 RidA family protein [Rhizobium leguminosarum]
MTSSPSERLKELGIALPAPRKPVANFLPYKQCGNLLYLSGQGPVDVDGRRYTGKVGGDVTAEEAYEHARLTTLNLLAMADAALGSLDNVLEVVKILGFVNAVPEFSQHPRVINGCSDLLLSIFGPERGAHARSAIGAGSLPNQITVEIEMIILTRG